MTREVGACLICGKPLVYTETAQEMKCAFCGKSFESYASCEDGHYVCDACHAKKGLEVVREVCLAASSDNPVAILQKMMASPFVHMHGPEHHIMVGAALLAAYHHAGGVLDWPKAMEEMMARGSQYPGGSCGFWGCCGAAVSTGMFMSIVTGATPMTRESWGLSNLMTARVLEAIGTIGGPRCCKRNSFTAVREAVAFVHEHLGVQMTLPAKIACAYSYENKECLRHRCPYYVGH